jgi:hypothetical protein
VYVFLQFLKVFPEFPRFFPNSFLHSASKTIQRLQIELSLGFCLLNGCREEEDLLLLLLLLLLLPLLQLLGMMIQSHNTILRPPRQVPNTHKQTNKQINSPLTQKHRIKYGGIAFKLKQRVQSLVSQKNLGIPSPPIVGCCFQETKNQTKVANTRPNTRPKEGILLLLPYYSSSSLFPYSLEKEESKKERKKKVGRKRKWREREDKCDNNQTPHSTTIQPKKTKNKKKKQGRRRAETRAEIARRVFLAGWLAGWVTSHD